LILQIVVYNNIELLLLIRWNRGGRRRESEPDSGVQSQLDVPGLGRVLLRLSRNDDLQSRELGLVGDLAWRGERCSTRRLLIR
jgi:hypothetical protein